MNDLISRQAAIDAVMDFARAHTKEGLIHWTGIKAILENVPTGWIPCSERLPEDGERVLTQSVFKSYGVGIHFLQEGNWYDRHGLYCYNKDDVIAWQPLPEPFSE